MGAGHELAEAGDFQPVVFGVRLALRPSDGTIPKGQVSGEGTKWSGARVPSSGLELPSAQYSACHAV